MTNTDAMAVLAKLRELQAATQAHDRAAMERAKQDAIAMLGEPL